MFVADIKKCSNFMSIFNLTMKKFNLNCKSILLALGMAGSLTAVAEAPQGYYATCSGKSGQSLLVALRDVVGNHTVVSYSGLWDLYRTSDVRPDGKIWDMYSTKSFTFKTDQCGQYSSVGDCYNREHSFPKSWFNDASPMVSDGFHIYPTDGKVNGQRSNWPYGECSNGTTLPAPSGIKALGKLGDCTFPGYSGTVFEPDDQYKGDFARSYFYMAAAYNDRISSWSSPMLNGTNYPAFSGWALNLLLKWHRQDPVSKKETDRNDAVAAAQHNRNPFIDHPELVEYIWGDKKGEAWTPGSTSEATLLLPVNNSNLWMGTTVAGYPRTATVTVKGINLASDVTLSVSGQAFSVSPATVSKSVASSADGASVQVKFAPTAAGNFGGTLIVSSGSLRSIVNLSGSAINTLPAGPVVSVGDNSFAATWSNVGDTDAQGMYTITVTQDGAELEGYPRKVVASTESHLVEGLAPNTTYVYTVSSEHLTSAPVSVTTLQPIPSVDFLFDGRLQFVSTPGEPSEVAEVLLEMANITGDVILCTNAPFELSTDKASWSKTVTVNSEEDRVYVRMFSNMIGEYHGSVSALYNEMEVGSAELIGTTCESINFNEGFELVDEKSQSYNPPQYQGNAALWNMTEAGIWPLANEAHSGEQAVRLSKKANSQIEMANDFRNGFGEVSFWAKRYNNDAEATVVLEVSTDGGNEWTEVGTAQIETNQYTKFTFNVGKTVPARLRLRQTAGARVNIDDIESTTPSALVPDAVADYHTWDAFCRASRLVIETAAPAQATVYALDGTTVFADTVAAGSVSLDLAPGLYIVSIGDFARRIVVK